MLRTPLCDLLDLDVPIVAGAFGPWDEVDLAAGVCESGGLGTLGTAARGPDELRAQWRRLRELTARPFALNHTGRPFDPDVFQAMLDARPAAISFHMGVDADLVARAHDRGITWLQTVGDVHSAEAALKAGADVLIAQGSEAGGHAGWVSTLVIVPSVVDVAGDIPVVAAGGIADGRGVAAAFTLGAQGACLGTRLLATAEMAVDRAWKDRIVDARASDAVKVAHHERVLPPFTLPQPGAPPAPRSLRTPLIDQLEVDPDGVDVESLGPQLLAAILAGGGHEFLPFAGQSAELVRDVPPVRELMTRIVTEAEAALGDAFARVTGRRDVPDQRDRSASAGR